MHALKRGQICKYSPLEANNR